MHPKHISIADYTYHLPDDRIARYPLPNRDDSQLFVYQQGQITRENFPAIVQHLPAHAMLVFNNSRVVEARLLFQKATGGIIELFALEPHEQYADITTAMNCTGSIQYKCLVGGANKWKAGMLLQKEVQHEGETVLITATMQERRSDCFIIHFSWTPASLAFAQILHLMGEMPIPPYLQRKAEASDLERYQTVYASQDGSVAAPTAGLHFTPAIQEALVKAGHPLQYVTLHVGAGTFKPVKADSMQDHEMHAEFIDVDTATVEALLQQETIIPVGTTSMRTLESVYWMGVKTFHQPGISLQALEMQQWEVYDTWLQQNPGKEAALNALLQWMRRQGLQRLILRTQIIIAPGYVFQLCKGLVTNFHQPNSTLLLLVAALIGEDWQRLYQYALDHEGRFLSYGDSSLLLP
jgi:S-adenosylmethionine:tRNA ribosyltransferase-isomerase